MISPLFIYSIIYYGIRVNIWNFHEQNGVKRYAFGGECTILGYDNHDGYNYQRFLEDLQDILPRGEITSKSHMKTHINII
jgi:hypothetical protein